MLGVCAPGTFAGSAVGREARVTGHAGEGAVRVGAHPSGTRPLRVALVHVCRMKAQKKNTVRIETMERKPKRKKEKTTQKTIRCTIS